MSVSLRFRSANIRYNAQVRRLLAISAWLKAVRKAEYSVSNMPPDDQIIRLPASSHLKVALKQSA
jgi:hypothetical protein